MLFKSQTLKNLLADGKYDAINYLITNVTMRPSLVHEAISLFESDPEAGITAEDIATLVNTASTANPFFMVYKRGKKISHKYMTKFASTRLMEELTKSPIIEKDLVKQVPVWEMTAEFVEYVSQADPKIFKPKHPFWTTPAGKDLIKRRTEAATHASTAHTSDTTTNIVQTSTDPSSNTQTSEKHDKHISNVLTSNSEAVPTTAESANSTTAVKNDHGLSDADKNQKPVAESRRPSIPTTKGAVQPKETESTHKADPAGAGSKPHQSNARGQPK